MIESHHFASHVPLGHRLRFIKDIEPFSMPLFSFLLSELKNGNYISDVRRDDAGCEVILLNPFRSDHPLGKTSIVHEQSAHYGDNYFDQDTGDTLTSPLPTSWGNDIL